MTLDKDRLRCYSEVEFQLPSIESEASRFVVPEVVPSGKIAFGIASTNTDKYFRRVVATNRYLKEGYITEDDLSEDYTYRDAYEKNSVPLVAKVDGRIVASMRLIENTPLLGLPTNKDEQIQIFENWKQKAEQSSFEVSQLAKVPDYKSHNPTLGLIRTYIVYSLNQQKYESVAVIDEGVRRMLNGPFMGFGLPEIGPTVHYMGSDSTPVFIDVINLTANCRKNGHPDLADFLEGKDNVQGFDWYVGP